MKSTLWRGISARLLIFYLVGSVLAHAESSTRRLLVLSDIHYVHQAPKTANISQRRTDLGIELVRRVREKVAGTKFDVVVVLGDVVDNGRAPWADEDATEVSKQIDQFGCPVIFVPGNHDGPALKQQVERTPVPLIVPILSTSTAPSPSCATNVSLSFAREKGVGLFSFQDSYDKEDRARRSATDLTHLVQWSETHPEQPVVVLQHNPVYPPIRSSYPYMIEDAAQVMNAYEKSRVVLSLSGHYHPGQKAVQKGGVTYATCPALCEKPFRFLTVELENRRVAINEHALEPAGCSSFMESPSAAR